MSLKSSAKSTSGVSMSRPAKQNHEDRSSDQEANLPEVSDEVSVTSSSTSSTATSRSNSPNPPSLLGELPEPVADFFSTVSLKGFPPSTGRKVQPWREIWHGPVEASPDGKLLVACPEITVYGSNNLGGY